MKKNEHTHRYRRIKSSGIFRCMLPGCRHYLTKEFAEGAISSCYRCGNDFILNKRNMALETPHCNSCTTRRNIKESDLEEFKKLLESKKIS